MAETTKISWTDSTFNPWIGCSKVHTGCRFCYAEADQDLRRGRAKWGDKGTRSRTSDANWRKPIQWNRNAQSSGKRHLVFCASLADIFEPWAGPIVDHNGEIILRPYLDRENTPEHRVTDPSVEDWWCDGEWQRHPDPQGWSPIRMNDIRADLFGLIDDTPYLTWQLLTKRPENVREMLTPYSYHACVTGDCPHDCGRDCNTGDDLKYRDSVWIGTSVSDQETADEMVPRLMELRGLAPVLFVSAEPLLGPIDLSPWIDKIDQVIVGGESGPNARECDIAAVRDIVRQCQAADTAAFVKQLGSNPIKYWCQGECGVQADGVTPCPTESGYGRLNLGHKSGANPAEWPESLRVQQFPKESLTNGV